jgi:hypothetical protein
MRNHIAGTIAITGLIIFIFGTDCNAQSVGRVVADIPFDFYVGQELLSKGKYEFEQAGRQTSPSAVIIRPLAKSARRSMIVPTIASSIRRSDNGFSLTFNRYGEVFYLATIQADAGGLVMKLNRTSEETQLSKRVDPTPRIIRPNGMAGN